jgi:cyclic pyranopterin phosphate synthase
MPEEGYDFAPASRLMQIDELDAITKIFVAHGINKIRLTGGEPLVRKDATTIIEKLGALPVKLTLTTNATRLHHFAHVLQDAGVTSLNISLDTLQADKFLLMTRRDNYDLVRKNIELMMNMGFHVKVNVVTMKGLNDNEILDFIAWTKDAPLHVRFIEFMPFSGNRWHSEKVITWQEILSIAGQAYDIIPLERDKHDTAKKYIVPGHLGTFAVISTMSAPFCSDCNRLRLTADGKMKNCLFSKTETDLLTAYRAGQDIVPLIYQSIRDKKKALGGQFVADIDKVNAAQIENRSMITIGG